jgi:hypothetical protein
MKINLNRDGDQFNRYQQNEHSSFTIAELPEHNNKQTTAYHVENPGPAPCIMNVTIFVNKTKGIHILRT